MLTLGQHSVDVHGDDFPESIQRLVANLHQISGTSLPAFRGMGFAHDKADSTDARGHARSTRTFTRVAQPPLVFITLRMISRACCEKCSVQHHPSR